MTGQEPGKAIKKTAQWYSTGAWLLIVGLALRVVGEVGAQMLMLDFDAVGWTTILNEFLRSLLATAPTILIIFALVDFADFFDRSEAGAAFTERNVKTLKSGADSLIAAAAFSVVITPTLLRWTAGDISGLVVEVNDLAMGVAAMGVAIHGVAVYLREAVRIKKENDEII